MYWAVTVLVCLMLAFVLCCAGYGLVEAILTGAL